jgi:hypothetical protein
MLIPNKARIPLHVDPTPKNNINVMKMNIILKDSLTGGHFVIEGTDVPATVGDAFIFRPDLCRHELVESIGDKLFLSVEVMYE